MHESEWLHGNSTDPAPSLRRLSAARGIRGKRELVRAAVHRTEHAHDDERV